MENASWKERLATLQQCIIFIDEGAPFLRSKEFTRMVKGSDNYFVLVTRDSLEHLPYSIEEIYGMRQERDSQKYQNAKEYIMKLISYIICRQKRISNQIW